MARTPLEVLEAISHSGAAMSALLDTSCVVEGAQPPETYTTGPLAGTLVMVNDAGDLFTGADDQDPADFHARNPGHGPVTLGDLVLEVVNGG